MNHNAACGAVMCRQHICLSKSSAVRRALICFFGRRIVMAVSYKKLWKLLIDMDIKKKDLSSKAGVSPATITKMGKGGHVTTEVLLKICSALDCKIEDIVEFSNQ